jgi:SAV_6107-like HEPN
MTTATLARLVARPSRATAPSAPMRSMAAAQSALTDAATTNDPMERYASAHLAALRAAATLLAHRSRPTDGRPRRPASAWTLLGEVAPELQPWSASFAAGAGKRAAALAGLPGSVTAREADDLIRDAAAFVAIVETTLGMLSLAGADMAAGPRRQ